MIEIIGTALNQWDVGRSVKVTDASHVHFANQGDSKAVIMELVDSQALIPDYLLQTGKQLCVYAVANGVTIESKMFSVKNRERPENYVYEEDQRNYIYTLITDAQEATNAANQAAKDILEAKERGDFNGPKGEPGKNGVGIDRIEFDTPSSEPGGENHFTIYLTDGREEHFSLMNGEDGASIHYCTFDGELAESGTLDGYSMFPNGLPKVKDLFATASGYLGIVTSVYEDIMEGTASVGYNLVADLNAKAEERFQSIEEAVFETVEVTSDNLFNPNTAEQAVIASADRYVSELIPCAVGDVIYGRLKSGDSGIADLRFGIYQVDASGEKAFVTVSVTNTYTVTEHIKTPNLVGIQVIITESDVSYADRTNVMITVNKVPTMFNPWVEDGLQKKSLLEKTKAELQGQIDEMGNAVFSIFKKTKNLFDENNALLDMRIIPGIGTPYAQDGYHTTDFIPVSVGDKLVASYDKNGVRTPIQIDAVAIYDADKNFMSQSAVNGTNRFVGVYEVAVEKTAFVRLTFTNTKSTLPYRLMVEKAESISAEYEPFGYIASEGDNTASRWKGKNVLVFGDSISSDTYMNNSLKWNHILQREKEFVHHNYSVHGYGFLCGQGTTTVGDRSMIMQIENAKTAGVEPDLIVLFMGTNDAGNHVPLGEYGTGMDANTLTTAITDTSTITTFTAAVEYCMAKILEYWCGVPVAVLLPLKRQGYVDPVGTYYLWKYAEVLQATAEKFAFPVLDLFHKSYFNPENSAFRAMYTHDWDGSGSGDGLHPTQWWSENRLAPMIGSFIESI